MARFLLPTLLATIGVIECHETSWDMFLSHLPAIFGDTVDDYNLREC